MAKFATWIMMAVLPCAGLVGAVARAEPAAASSPLAQQFGARESVEQISLSPDGSRVAFIAPLGARGAAVFVAPVDGGAVVRVLQSTGEVEHLRECHWSAPTRLVCQAYIPVADGSATIGFTRLYAIDADGRNLKQLSARESSIALRVEQNGGDIVDWLGSTSGAVLMTRTYVPEVTTGTRLASSQSGMGVDRIDTNSLRRTVVELPRDDAVDFISDGNGTVRLMGVRPPLSSGYDGAKTIYSYRLAGSRSWLPFGSIKVLGDKLVGFSPEAIDRDHNLVYGYDDEAGRNALFSISLDGSLKRALVLSRPDVDIDSLVRIGGQRRVVGASFVTDRRQIEFFDPALKKLATSLSKALPGLPLVSFVDASADEGQLLLFAGSDVDPGRYFRFDKTTRHLAEVLPVRPQLSATTLATVKPMFFTAGDGTQIPGYLTLPPGSTGHNLPAIVMPHGGPGARDEWGFDWLAQFFAARGFAVLQPNFRGSTGYGEAWFKENGFKSWRLAIGDINDGGRWLVKQGIADPAKLAIVGWSYGGYAALQSAVLDPGLFKAIVAIAPVTDLETLRSESVNFTNHVQEDLFIGHGPHVREGSPAQNVARIAAPVLMFHGDRDQNVGIGESRMMVSLLKAAGKNAELVEFHGLDHQLDDSNARAAMLDQADAFLRRALAM